MTACCTSGLCWTVLSASRSAASGPIVFLSRANCSCARLLRSLIARADALVEMAIRSRTVPADGRRPEPLFSVFVGFETFAGRICELANGTVVFSSVWRLAVVYSPQGLDAYIPGSVATPVLDPRVPVLNPANIHR